MTFFIHSKVYLVAIDALKCISNFMSHFTGYVIIYPRTTGIDVHQGHRFTTVNKTTIPSSNYYGPLTRHDFSMIYDRQKPEVKGERWQ